MIKQQKALLATEGVELDFSDDAIHEARARPYPAPAPAPRPRAPAAGRLPSGGRRAPRRQVARVAEEVNSSVDNIGARRLHTVLERILEEISFEAPERARRPAARAPQQCAPRQGACEPGADDKPGARRCARRPRAAVRGACAWQ
jgi:ATP-dependent HslUV protease ATP-binding subunit HslU